LDDRAGNGFLRAGRWHGSSEDFVKSVISYALENCKDDLDFFTDDGERHRATFTFRCCQTILFERLTYTETIEILLKSETA
jgi:asparaginyl-tRNA synthetase